MEHPHILLIALDTVRRDHLGCYGYSREITPNIDRLADRGVRFVDSVGNCGWTLPQHVTLHTGLYPLTHGCLLLREDRPIPRSVTTLAEHLKATGYACFGGVNPNNYGGGAKYDYDRGFDRYDACEEYNQHMEWTADWIADNFRQHHEDSPCFLYVHVNASHEPWEPPEPWPGIWGPSYHNQYEAELSYVDYHLGRAFSAMKGMEIFDDTLIVIFSDHGTEFAEHGFYEKKVNLYNEILSVPLIFHCPSQLPKERVVDGLVETVDVAPTICEIAGVPPFEQAQGENLLPRMLGEGGHAREFVCSHTVHDHQAEGGDPQFDHFAVQSLGYKFIRLELHVDPDELHSDWEQRCQNIMLRAGRDPADLEKNTVVRELYDLRADPGEHRSLLNTAANPPAWRQEVATEDQQKAEDLEEHLDNWIEETRAARRE
ncbi:MAG: sulfatase [Planctomycetes bacterium]|nr:sulfatase [Planctomycetota bacterium]